MTQVKGFHSSEHLVFLQKEKKKKKNFLLLSHPSQQESEKLSSTQVKASGSFQQIPANLCDAQALCHSLREEEKKKKNTIYDYREKIFTGVCSREVQSNLSGASF